MGTLWPDLRNKGSDTKKFVTAPPSPFLGKAFAESFLGVWGFKVRATCLLAGPCCKPFPIPNSDVFGLVWPHCASGTQTWVSVTLMF